jgi:hypothetical protein
VRFSWWGIKKVGFRQVQEHLLTRCRGCTRLSEAAEFGRRPAATTGGSMRSCLLIAFAMAVAGCNQPKPEESAVSLRRDLTLAPAPDREIVSSVELERPQPRVTSARATRRHVSARKSPPVDLEPIRPATIIQASPQQTETAPEPASGRELPPGKTVTLIPASSGPSTAADPGVDEGLLMIQRGHWCPPPRPGIGVRRPPAMY